MIEIGELQRFALVYLLQEDERPARIHSGSVRLLLPDVAVIHEVPTGSDSDCCTVPVIVPFASIQEINIFPSIEALEKAMDDDDIGPQVKRDASDPEVMFK